MNTENKVEEIIMVDMSHIIERNRKARSIFGADHAEAVKIFEHCVKYDLAQTAELVKMSRAIQADPEAADIQEKIAAFNAFRKEIKPSAHPAEPIYLWPEGKIPCCSDYTDNSEHLFNHDPDYAPFMYEVLLPEDTAPKGAIILCPGGDHGESTVNTYQVALDLNALGYQCFLLLNRTNRQPWKAQDAGADSARAVRYVRKHAAKYRIAENHIAFAGFSNGGLTGEALIEYHSGTHKMTDIYPDYIPDELDAVSADLNAFLCIYGPRFNGDPFNYEGVVYPPTFYAVGREDGAMDNLHWVYPDLVKHGIPVEVHTFAGTPHGKAGAKLYDGEVRYPNFELWLPLADCFLMDLFK